MVPNSIPQVLKLVTHTTSIVVVTLFPLILTFAMGVGFALMEFKDSNDTLLFSGGMIAIVVLSIGLSEIIKARLQKKLVIWHKSQLKKTQLKKR